MEAIPARPPDLLLEGSDDQDDPTPISTQQTSNPIEPSPSLSINNPLTRDILSQSNMTAAIDLISNQRAVLTHNENSSSSTNEAAMFLNQPNSSMSSEVNQALALNMQSRKRARSPDDLSNGVNESSYSPSSNCSSNAPLQLTVNSQVFTCEICCKEFYNARNYERHLVSHNIERNYLCPKCPKTYKYKWDLNRHYERKHMDRGPLPDFQPISRNGQNHSNSFKCGVCGFVSADRTQFEKHCQTPPCSETLRDVSDGKASSDEEYDQDEFPFYKCNSCNEAFDSRLLLKQHKLEHLQTFSCNSCNRLFLRAEALSTHQCPGRSNHQIYLCSVCHSSFTDSTLYRKHCNEVCQVACDAPVASQLPLLPNGSQNSSTSSGVSNVPEVMSKLHENYINSAQSSSGTNTPPFLNQHPLSVSSSQPEPCSICGKVFATVSNLKRHMMSHSKVRNFKCNLCSKSYIYKWDLTNHMKKAHREYAANMPVSGLERSFSPNYLQHDGVGSNSQKNKKANNIKMTCKHCGGVFMGQNSLHAHLILRHSGVIDDIRNDITSELLHYVENYTCKVCGKSFADKRVYKNHCATHTQGGASSSGFGANNGEVSSSKEIYCNGCRAELMTDGIDLPSDEEVEYLCDVCDNERRSQEEAAGLAF